MAFAQAILAICCRIISSIVGDISGVATSDGDGVGVTTTVDGVVSGGVVGSALSGIPSM